MSEIRFNWSVAFLTVDANVVPDERALVTALQVCAGLSVCQGLVPALVPVAERHERPRFYGSERFSYHAQCPQCGGRVDRGEKGTEGRRWFLRVDDLASLGAEGDTPITMPGCNHVVPLAAIAFEFPTGAARCAIIVSLPVWMDAWFDDSPEVEAGLAALSEAIGTPMRIVRSLVDTHPRARRAIKRLVSEDAAGRPDAVRALCELNEDDPEGRPVFADYCADHEDALLGVLHTDPCVEVRDCAMWLLVEGKCFKSLYGFVEAHLRQCDDETQQCLMVCVNAPLALYAPLVPLICGLASASSPAIRSNCAWALHHLQAHGPEEREVIRALALDVPEPSDYAIHAMEAWIRKSGAPPQDIDMQVLREVVKRFPQSAAASIAKKLVANCAQEKSATLDGVHIVKQVDGFSPDQGLPVARSPEPVDLAALRASYLNN